MQHDHVLKKLNSDTIARVGGGGGGGGGGAFVIPFNLICNMYMFCKSWEEGQISLNFSYKVYFKDIFTKLCMCSHK